MESKSLSLWLLMMLYCPFFNTAQEICEDGWVQFTDNFGNSVCVLVVKEPAEWKAAMMSCNEKLGKLVHLDNYGDLSYYRPNSEIATFLGQELVENYNVEEFWSGLHVNRGRLMWDDYGPKLVERSKFSSSRSWQWGESHPNTTAGSCGKATVVKRITVEGPVYEYTVVTVNLTTCDTMLPFVCRKPPAVRVVKAAAFCPENWLGNQYTSHCYRIYKESVSYEKAKARCKEEGTNIAPSTTNFDLYFLKAVFDFYSKNDKYFEVIPVSNIWVNDTNNTERCSALYTLPSQGNVPAIDDVDCLSKLLFMCVVETKYAGSGNVETRSPYFNQDKLLDHPPFDQFPVYGVLERNLRENEVIFVRTPSFILNSSDSFLQWNYGNTVSWRLKSSDRVSVPYYVNISLPFYQSQQRRRRDNNNKNAFYVRSDRQERQIGEFPSTTPATDSEGDNFPLEGNEIFNFVNYDSVRQTTGYYTFGIYNTNPPRYIEESPQLVRYSEKDLYVYVAYCDFLDYVIGDIVSREDVNSFNLLQDDSYLGNLQEIGLGRILYSTPDGYENSVEYYRSQFEAFIDNTVKFRVFVVPRVGREQTENYEQIVQDAVYEHFQQNLPNDFFDVKTLQVRSTVMCPFLETVKDGKNLTFQPIRAGETGFSWERCYPDNKALATSTCTGGYDNGATWRQISLADDCGTVPKYNQSASTVNLKNLSETEITRDNFQQVLNDTAGLTDPDLNLTVADVIYTADILYNYLQFDIVNTPETMDTVFKVVDNVLKSGSDDIHSAQKITNAANRETSVFDAVLENNPSSFMYKAVHLYRIILAVDELTNKLGKFSTDYVQFIQDLVASEVWEQTGSNDLTIGINLNKTATTVIKKEALSSVQQPGDVVALGTDTAIYLTESLLKGGKSKLTFQIYGNTDLFSVIRSKFKINSKVAAARLTKNDIPVVDLGEEYVTAVFYTFENSKSLVCAYWNYSANEDAGGWETDGCTLFSQESGRVVCKCNHLTNFAVLIDLNANTITDTDKLVLGIITKVGLVISIICLGITIVTFLMFKHLRNGRGQQVLVNLSTAMLCSAILFLVGIDRTESYGGCVAVSVLLHYFILVTFMWMLVEGVLQYLRFVKVLGTYIPKFMIKSMIPAWGIPLIPVIIVLALDYDMYYGGNGYCWMSWRPFLYAFVIPTAVILLANLIVFTMVMCNLCCRRKHKGLASNQSERKMAFLHFQAGVSILVILGLTWVFGFLTIDDTRIVFHYLFAIFNAFQGVFIFMLFTAREKQIRNAWRKLCCKQGPYKTSASGTDSHPGKQSADHTGDTSLHNTTNGSKSNGNNDNP